MGIHFTELIIIAAIALIVMGPEKFPDFAKLFLRTIKDLRGYMDEVKEEVTKEIRPIEREMRNLSKYSPDKYLDSMMDSDKKDSDKKESKTVGSKGKTTGADQAPKSGTPSDDVPPAEKKKEQPENGSQTPPDTQQYGDLNAAGTSSTGSKTADTVPEGSDYVNGYKQAGGVEEHRPNQSSGATTSDNNDDTLPHGADGAGDLRTREVRQKSASTATTGANATPKKKTRPEDIPPPEPLD